MNKRALKKLLEANNAKSPDILTAIVLVNNQTEAWRTAVIFEEVTGDDLPFNLDEWERTVRPPAQLYFRFERKRDQGRFVKRMRKEYPELEVTI